MNSTGHLIGVLRFAPASPCSPHPPLPALSVMLNWVTGGTLLTSLVLGLIVWQYPAPFGDPADPTDMSFVPQPEWWVLWLNQLVSIFRGPWQVIGTAVIPLTLVIGLLSVPWVNWPPIRHPLRHQKQRLLAIGVIVAIIILSLTGYLEHYTSQAVE